MGITLGRIWPGRFFQRSREPAPPTAPYWDFHCHLLPGVDDGLRTLDETRMAIAGLQRMGYRGAVLTPHIYPGVYANDPEGLRRAFADLQRSLEGGFALRLAAEYFADETMFDAIAQDDLLYLPLGNKKIVLVEFPALMPAPFGMDVLIKLSQAGYQAVLAHVERYRYVQQVPDVWLGKITQTGAWLQCDIGSLVGQYGPKPQNIARWLLDHDLPALWGTDLHRVEQLDRYVIPGLVLLAKSGHRTNVVLEELLA